MSGNSGSVLQLAKIQRITSFKIIPYYYVYHYNHEFEFCQKLFYTEYAMTAERRQNIRMDVVKEE